MNFPEMNEDPLTSTDPLSEPSLPLPMSIPEARIPSMVTCDSMKLPAMDAPSNSCPPGDSAK
ncbi:hypothetical protein Dimus_005664, partial [Dionaea muscipula]